MTNVPIRVPTRVPTCPHCGGRQLYFDDEWACLQCGWREPPREVLPLVRTREFGPKRTRTEVEE